MLMTRADVVARLATHEGWQLQGEAIVRQFVFPAFADAIAFVTRLAFDAEASDHHPDLLIQYRRVTVTWSTHSEGGVTERDFSGVVQTDRAAAMAAGR